MELGELGQTIEVWPLTFPVPLPGEPVFDPNGQPTEPQREREPVEAGVNDALRGVLASLNDACEVLERAA
jgi:hypothetical protein